MSSHSTKLDALISVCLTVFSLAFFPSCSTQSPGDSHEATVAPTNDGAVGNQGGQVSYIYSWQKDGIDSWDETQWTTRSDLGYRIVVDAGYIVSYSSSLVPCIDANPTEGGFIDRVGDWLFAGLFGFQAWAGHGDVADQSTLGVSFVERIGGDDTVRTVNLGDNATYCDVHYLIARGDPMTQTQSDYSPMENRSLLMQGTYLAPGSNNAVPFNIDISIAYGLLESTLHSHVVTETPIENGTSVHVQITRPMADIFDGIEFENISALSLGRKVLRGLVDNTVLSRELRPRLETNPEAGR